MDNEKTVQKPSALESVFDFVEVAVFALVMVAVLFAFFIRIVGVEGGSMNDTLADGDRLVLTKAFYTPERGDIVVVRRENNTPLIKRVIAVAGDTVEIDTADYMVILNGEKIVEPYVNYPTLTFDMYGPVTVPEGHVFVMGDHRDSSHDSRKNDIGCVDEDMIVGKAVWRFYPLNAFGGIYDNMK
ncbi:MAG: signal peptidase I [Clostridia bacterium]|nr:signal peptidase I [Clostridia bacterium]